MTRKRGPRRGGKLTRIGGSYHEGTFPRRPESRSQHTSASPSRCAGSWWLCDEKPADLGAAGRACWFCGLGRDTRAELTCCRLRPSLWPVDAKQEVRERVWDLLQREGVARFPGARGRIPNFRGAE